MNNELQTICNIVSRNDKRGVRTILDVEDSLEIPGEPSQSSQSRIIAREKLQHVTSVVPAESLMGIRINHVGSNEFIKDMECLQQITLPLHHIVLPKVNHVEELQTYFYALQTVHQHNLEILLETEAGIHNLNGILDVASSLGISNIHFGHWDYFLSCGTYPIPAQDCTVFWDVATPLMQTISAKGFTYIHPPVNRLTDHTLLYSVIKVLSLHCNSLFGIATLTNGQSKNAIQGLQKATPLQLKSVAAINQLDHATKLVEAFQHKEYSFSINEDQIFIAPHEYLAALQYIALCNKS